MYYSLIEEKILFEVVNNHPLFSYALNTLLKTGEKCIIYVKKEFDIELVKEYHDSVYWIDETVLFKGDKIDLNRPLLSRKHLNGLKDKSYEFTVNDDFDLKCANSLICSNFCDSRPEKIFKRFKILKHRKISKPKLLFTAPYEFFEKSLKDYIKNNYEVTYAYQAPIKVIKSLIIDQDILFTSTCPTYLIDESLLRNSKIQIIATPSTGTNHIDMSYLSKKDIDLVSIKTSNIIEKIYASSEFSFTLLLAMVNKLPQVIDNAHHGGWRENETELRSNELDGMKIGLIGYGRIGKKMAKYSNALGMEVHVYDPKIEITEDWVVVHKIKSDLLKTCDIVSLHYHLDDDSKGSFSTKDFSIMRQGSYFLNTARAELVDEHAMLDNLRKGKLKAAAVDVISNEHIYNKWNHPVVKFARENDNLIVSSHVAGLTVESESKAAYDIFKQLEKKELNGYSC